jgi:hypothetical protein
MIGQAWVFRCDKCGTHQMVYIDGRRLAVQKAIANGWTVDTNMCYCQDCTAKRLAKTQEESK